MHIISFCSCWDCLHEYGKSRNFYMANFQKHPFHSGIVFLAYQGFELITNAAEYVSNPEITLPKALYLNVVLVTFIYVLVSLMVIGNLSISEIENSKDYALAAALKPFLGVIGFKIMAFAALISTSSAINAALYGGQT